MDATWNTDQLDKIGGADELRLSARRSDGSLRPFTTMWVVRTGDELFVRSAGGSDRPWYRHALASRAGRISAGGVEADVTFAKAESGSQGAIDTAYHHKYDSYGAIIVGHVTGIESHDVTIRLLPVARQV
jgi:hypothetical protein